MINVLYKMYILYITYIVSGTKLLLKKLSACFKTIPLKKQLLFIRTPRAQQQLADDKKTVNFPENLLSLPQRLENMIAEQQRRLDRAVIDTSGRTPPRTSQSLPHLSSDTIQDQPEIHRG